MEFCSSLSSTLRLAVEMAEAMEWRRRMEGRRPLLGNPPVAVGAPVDDDPSSRRLRLRRLDVEDDTMAM